MTKNLSYFCFTCHSEQETGMGSKHKNPKNPCANGAFNATIEGKTKRRTIIKMYYVYVLSNWNHHVLYIGVTNNLKRRVQEHKNKLVDGYTKRYNVNKLLYFECYYNVKEAIRREKQLKAWTRERKNKLILSSNPALQDLFEKFE